MTRAHAPRQLTFGVVGNLGHDQSGLRQQYEFDSGPWKGFVKATCESDLTDPSINHMFVVDNGDSSAGVEHYTTDTTVAYEWIEIVADGEAIPPGEWTRTGMPDDLGAIDDGYVIRTMPFAFPYYGEPHDDLHVGTNGYVTLGTAHYAWGNSMHVPTPAGNLAGVEVDTLIAPMWADMDPGSGGQIYYHATPDRAVVTYDSVAYCCGSADPHNTFQIVLYPSGDMQFNYKELQQSVGGQIPSIGYESHDGTQGTQIFYGWESLTDRMQESSIRITASMLHQSPKKPVHSCHDASYAEVTCGAKKNADNTWDTSGSDTNFDDDQVSNIPPGSMILYLVYSTINRGAESAMADPTVVPTGTSNWCVPEQFTTV